MFDKEIKIYGTTEVWLVSFVFLSYAIGTLVTLHYLPSQVDFIPNIIVVGLLSLGLIGILFKIRVKRIGLDSVFWMLLILFILVQTLFVPVFYPDALIFPIGTFLICLLLSIVTNNIDNKDRMIGYSAYCLIIVGSFNLLAQLLQYIGVVSPLLMPLREGDIRFYGNVAQPNQLAFIYALALAACHFLQLKIKKSYNLINYFFIALFALGIALSSSRGGLILAIASVTIYLLNIRSFKEIPKLLYHVLPVSLVMWLGYMIGLYLLKIYAMPTSADAISRMTEGSLHLRAELLQQAWISFTSSPLIGVGFGNLLADSLNHIEELDWFVFSIHSHNLVMQIAAELGIIGLLITLIPIYIIIKRLFSNRTLEMNLVLVLLLLVGLYCFSEYPLWFTRFLLLAVFLLSIANQKTIIISEKIRKYLIALSVVLSIASVYYYVQYQDYSRVVNFLFKEYSKEDIDTMSIDEKEKFEDFQVAVVKDLKPVFGFSDYKELYIYILLPEDSEQLAEKIQLGQRVLSKFVTSTVLTKQALYYGLAHEQSNSLEYFKGACLINHKESCTQVTSYINDIALQDAQFIPIKEEYMKWQEKSAARN